MDGWYFLKLFGASFGFDLFLFSVFCAGAGNKIHLPRDFSPPDLLETRYPRYHVKMTLDESRVKFPKQRKSQHKRVLVSHHSHLERSHCGSDWIQKNTKEGKNEVNTMKATLFLLFLARSCRISASEEQSCSWKQTDEIDPALKEFTYDVGDGPK